MALFSRLAKQTRSLQIDLENELNSKLTRSVLLSKPATPNALCSVYEVSAIFCDFSFWFNLFSSSLAVFSYSLLAFKLWRGIWNPAKGFLVNKKKIKIDTLVHLGDMTERMLRTAHLCHLTASQD